MPTGVSADIFNSEYVFIYYIISSSGAQYVINFSVDPGYPLINTSLRGPSVYDPYRQMGNYYRQGRDRLIQLIPAMIEFTYQDYSGTPNTTALAYRNYLVRVSFPSSGPRQVITHSITIPLYIP